MFVGTLIQLPRILMIRKKSHSVNFMIIPQPLVVLQVQKKSTMLIGIITKHRSDVEVNLSLCSYQAQLITRLQIKPLR